MLHIAAPSRIRRLSRRCLLPSRPHARSLVAAITLRQVLAPCYMFAAPSRYRSWLLTNAELPMPLHDGIPPSRPHPRSLARPLNVPLHSPVPLARTFDQLRGRFPTLRGSRVTRMPSISTSHISLSWAGASIPTEIGLLLLPPEKSAPHIPMGHALSAPPHAAPT